MKKNKKIPSVTVAISAFNEEKNIVLFLKSVLSQKEDNFTLKKILVYSDGSTDKTVSKVRSLQSLKIKIVDRKKRLGKSARLNQIYKELDTDILVQSDADVIFSHAHVIRDLIQPLMAEKNVGMCGGHPMPLTATTFIEKAVNSTFRVYDNLRSLIHDGNNIFSADGRLLAYKSELVKKISVPPDMLANDAYTYFCCKQLSYEYRYVPSAVVFFRSPQTLGDQIKQNTRFLASDLRVKKYIPAELVNEEVAIPPHILIYLMLREFIKHPILCSSIFLINRYCDLKANRSGKDIGSKWDIAVSSKKLDDEKG